MKHNKNFNHPNFPHGKHAGYKAGCKCKLCNDANNVYKRVYNKKLREENKEYSEACRQNKRDYRQTERGKALYRSMNALRRKRKILQVPEKCDHSLLRIIYENCPEGYQVDHIIPLSLGGEHSPDNLQYLPTKINRLKSNKIDYDCKLYILKWQNYIV